MQNYIGFVSCIILKSSLKQSSHKSNDIDQNTPIEQSLTPTQTT